MYDVGHETRRRGGGATSFDIPIYANGASDSDKYFKAASGKPREKRRGKLCNCCIYGSLLLAILTALFALWYAFTTCPFETKFFELPPIAQRLTANQQADQRLQKVQKLFKGQITGPESIAVYQGTIATGTADGSIAIIQGGAILNTINLGTPCSPSCGYDSEPTAGRPLGLRFDHNGVLYVADAYLGIFTVDIKTGAKQRLLGGDTAVDGRPLRFINDLDVMNDGSIIFTDSSWTFQRRNFPQILVSDNADGRLLRFDPRTGQTTTLLSGLHFANGVQLSPDGTFVLVAEMGRARIVRYNLSGPGAGQASFFATGLSGLPDNIRLAADAQHYWVGLVDSREIMDYLGQRPWLRKIIGKFMGNGNVLSYFAYMKPRSATVVKLHGQTGHVVDALRDPSGSVLGAVSEVADVGNVLYFGSFSAPYLATLQIN